LFGSEEGVRLLLHFGADPNKEGYCGSNALALGAGYRAIVKLLLEKGADPNAFGLSDLDRPLVAAARAKNLESLRLMLAHGGDARRNVYGWTVLLSASRFTNAECCRELLAHGAHSRSCHSFHGTPMHMVVSYPNGRDGPECVKILELLLDAGASVQARDGHGFTPGQLARRTPWASKEVLEWFSRHEVEVRE
jgi:ankyrin repeat protein